MIKISPWFAGLYYIQTVVFSPDFDEASITFSIRSVDFWRLMISILTDPAIGWLRWLILWKMCVHIGVPKRGVWTDTNCLELKFVHQDPFLVAISTKPETQHTTSKRNLFACRQLRVNWHHCAANRQHFPIDRPDAGKTKVGNTMWYHIVMIPCIRWYLLFYPISLTKNPWSKGHFPSQQANRRR